MTPKLCIGEKTLPLVSQTENVKKIEEFDWDTEDLGELKQWARDQKGCWVEFIDKSEDEPVGSIVFQRFEVRSNAVATPAYRMYTITIEEGE